VSWGTRLRYLRETSCKPQLRQLLATHRWATTGADEGSTCGNGVPA
jgi:hypothetical protein